jgi:hypothetical protein
VTGERDRHLVGLSRPVVRRVLDVGEQECDCSRWRPPPRLFTHMRDRRRVGLPLHVPALPGGVETGTQPDVANRHSRERSVAEVSPTQTRCTRSSRTCTDTGERFQSRFGNRSRRRQATGDRVFAVPANGPLRRPVRCWVAPVNEESPSRHNCTHHLRGELASEYSHSLGRAEVDVRDVGARTTTGGAQPWVEAAR